MIEISFVVGISVFTAVWLLIRIIVWICHRGIDWHREAKMLLMYINLAVIFRIVFFPLERMEGHIQPLLFDPAQVIPFNTNLIPIKNIMQHDSPLKAWLNVIGNIAVFIPSGFLLPIVFPRLDRFWKVLLCGAGMSLCIELMQLPFFTRVTDIDDLIMNTLGCIIGYGIYAAVRASCQNGKKHQQSKEGSV